jgi:hypothetical protein
MISTIDGGSVKQGMLKVKILPDLIDFSKVSYVKVALAYSDPVNNIEKQSEVVFVADAEDPVTWQVELKDDSKRAYQWKATFFMTDGSTRTTTPVMTKDLSVILQLP